MTQVNESAIPIKPAGARPRLDHLDLLRGAIMIFMALDHTRDFFSHDAMLFDPTDLTKTHGWLFLTRWITHFCAPVFCFLAGTGAFLSLGRGKTKRDLSWFLLTRGVWLVVLELTLVGSAWTFSFDPHFFFLQVIWALGWSMVVLAAVIHLPLWGVAAFGLIMIAGHNLLDPIPPQSWGAWSGLWKVLHVSAPLEPAPGFNIFVAYPLIPWIGVMATGFAFGALMKRERAERRLIVLWLGLGLIAGFIVLRATNLYGDMKPWAPQSSPLFTMFSFVNCTKYPPSLLYLMMTLGPALVFLSLADRELGGAWKKPIIVFGRVPLFFYLLHLPLIHGIAVLLSFLHYGNANGILHSPVFPESEGLPADYGYGLLVVYAIWALVIVLLYPLCRWFADLKQRRRDPWLSYF